MDRRFAEIDPGQPALVLGLRADQAEALGVALAPQYPSEHQGLLLAEEGARPVAVGELAQTGIATGAALFLPPLRRPASFVALQQIVIRLRAPDGCPWDRELTPDKVRPFLLEETHELLEAMDSHKPAKVAEEIGDMLLQLAMQMQMASEEGLFSAPDVFAGIVTKLVRRHPHVFGDVAVSGTDEVLANWEAIKRDERRANGDRKSPLSGVPAGLPALAQADAYQERIAARRVPAAG